MKTKKEELHTHKQKTAPHKTTQTKQITLVGKCQLLPIRGNSASLCTNKLIFQPTLYLKSYIQLFFYIITEYIIKNLMKTYLQNQKNPQSLGVTRSHARRTHTCVSTHLSQAKHNTEGIPRGLCNKEHTNSSNMAVGWKLAHVHANDHTHARLRVHEKT